MKTNNFKNLLSVLLIVLFGTFVSACGESEPLYIAVTDVSLNKTEVEFIEGESVQLTATVQPAEATNKNVTWQSNNTAVVTVNDKGNVTAVKAGTAEITATANEGKMASCKITVKAKVIPVSSVELNKKELYFTETGTATLVATVSPDNATDKTLVWKSSNADVATVDGNGKVTANKIGTAEISATANNGDKTAICKVTVAPKLPLSYVAEYNINPAGNAFVTSYASNVSGYFNWDDAVSKFAGLNGITIDGKKYHLPTLYEWQAIFPYGDGNGVYYGSGSVETIVNKAEEITVNGMHKTFSGEYKNFFGETFALRFKKAESGNSKFPAATDNSMLCAFRYERQGTFNEGDYESRLKVTCRYLGNDFKGTLDDIAKESYWTSNNDNDVIRFFPLCGAIPRNKDLSQCGYAGYYWSATENNYSRAYRMIIFSFSAYTFDGFKTTSLSVRLFSDE